MQTTCRAGVYFSKLELRFSTQQDASRLQNWHLAYKTGVSFTNIHFSIYKQASRLTNWRLGLQLSNVSMWIRVATDKNAVHYGSSLEYTYVDGENSKEYYFDDDTAKELETDGFLSEMWSKLDAMFDWGDCDFFPPEKCLKFKEWLEQRLKRPTSSRIKQVYGTMLKLADLAIKCNTDISFDF